MSKVRQLNTTETKEVYDVESGSYKLYARAWYENVESGMPSFKSKWYEVRLSDSEKIILDTCRVTSEAVCDTGEGI